MLHDHVESHDVRTIVGIVVGSVVIFLIILCGVIALYLCKRKRVVKKGEFIIATPEDHVVFVTSNLACVVIMISSVL